MEDGVRKKEESRIAKLSKLLLFLASKKLDVFADNFSQHGTLEEKNLEDWVRFEEAKLAVLKREDRNSRAFYLAVDLKGGSRSWFFFLNSRSSSQASICGKEEEGDFLQAAVPDSFSAWKADCSSFKKIFAGDFSAAAAEDLAERESWTFSWLEDCWEALEIDLDKLLDLASRAVSSSLLLETSPDVALVPWAFSVDLAAAGSCLEKIELEMAVCGDELGLEREMEARRCAFAEPSCGRFSKWTGCSCVDNGSGICQAGSSWSRCEWAEPQKQVASQATS